MSLFSTGTVAAINTHVAEINPAVEQLGQEDNPPFVKLIARVLSLIVTILLLMVNDG